MPDFFDAIVPTGPYDGASKAYALPMSPNPPESLYLIYNGILLIKDFDYSLSAKVILFNNVAPKAKDILRAYFSVTSPPVQDQTIEYIFQEVPTGNTDGTNTLFYINNPPIPPSSLMLTLDGIYLNNPLDYTITDFHITLKSAPPAGAILLADYRIISSSTPPDQPPPPDRFNSYTKADIIYYIRNYLNDPGIGKLWTDGEIQRWISQAELEVTQRMNIYWIKFPLALVKGTGTYQMPVNLKGITRMTYRGVPVEMLTQKQMAQLSPVYRTQQSRVIWAYLQFEGYYTLRLFCTPYEDLPILSVGDDIYTDKNLLNEFQIGAFFYSMESDPNFILPDYLFRRTIRYYVCWKAFSVEGYGQDVNVGQYYRQKFEDQMKRNSVFFGKIYAAKERQLQPQYLNILRKVARPTLPPNFGPVVSPYS